MLGFRVGNFLPRSSLPRATSSTCHSILRHTWPLLLLVRPPIVLRRPVISIVNRYDTSSLHHGLRSKINLEFVGDIEPIHNFSHQLIRRATSPPVYPFSRYTSFEALRNSCELSRFAIIPSDLRYSLCRLIGIPLLGGLWPIDARRNRPEKENRFAS